MSNELLNVIRGRRSVLRFTGEPVSEEELSKILEAGRWAPSYANSQPWVFIVVKSEETKKKLGALVERIALFRRGKVALSGHGLGDPAVVIVVAVDPMKDPRHHVEAGAAATQNMALMAHALGLASYWAGIYGEPAEREVRRILGLPRGYRVISILPIGKPAYQGESERADLSELVRYEKF
ncbi:nitroreductase family protein [Candidatus Bipolaricaulota bacterium]|nr:nitroreductase family protein [Candidatus Bipolaricaulota bacterium]